MSRRLIIILAGSLLVLSVSSGLAETDATSDTESGTESGTESDREAALTREQIGVTGSGGEPKDAEAETLPSDPDPVGLDRLLKLPTSMTFNAERRQGATADEWRARFRASRESIVQTQRALKQTKAELDDLAGSGGAGNWQVAPPGSNQTENTPMSFKLREQLRQGREDLDEAERAQRSLIVEADLAGVPENWRHGN